MQFGTNPPVNSSMRIYMASDTADNVGKGDATVHAVVGHDRTENLFYVLDMYRAHIDVATGAQALLTCSLAGDRRCVWSRTTPTPTGC